MMLMRAENQAQLTRRPRVSINLLINVPVNARMQWSNQVAALFCNKYVTYGGYYTFAL